MTNIMECTGAAGKPCKHEAQDKLHGAGKRVHNSTKASPPRWRCTVCSKERDA